MERKTFTLEMLVIEPDQSKRQSALEFFNGLNTRLDEEEINTFIMPGEGKLKLMVDLVSGIEEAEQKYGDKRYETVISDIGKYISIFPEVLSKQVESTKESIDRDKKMARRVMMEKFGRETLEDGDLIDNYVKKNLNKEYSKVDELEDIASSIVGLNERATKKFSDDYVTQCLSNPGSSPYNPRYENLLNTLRQIEGIGVIRALVIKRKREKDSSSAWQKYDHIKSDKFPEEVIISLPHSEYEEHENIFRIFRISGGNGLVIGGGAISFAEDEIVIGGSSGKYGPTNHNRVSTILNKLGLNTKVGYPYV